MLYHLLINTANLIYLASYTAKDIKFLRWLTIAGIILLIPYYLYTMVFRKQPPPKSHIQMVSFGKIHLVI
jgi:hypothetical protein